MFSKIEIKEIKNYINKTSKKTKIYIGTDSTKLKKKRVRYATVVVIHQENSKGCKIFGSISYEKDIDYKASKPFNRMMNETYKSAEIYLELANVIGERHKELHLDINKDEKHGSSIAFSASVGYIKGVCGLNPKAKPSEESFAASCVADKWCKEG
jgi:predicted RNase H-related nuclease YkuK (DUF458 family)